MRKNRAIFGDAGAMLHDHGIPLIIWVEACIIVFYLQNRSGHKVLGDKNHEEDLFGNKPEVGHFRIFGYLTYSHVPFEKRKNLEPMAEKGIFFGYREDSKGFCIYIPSLRKTIV